MEFKKAKYWHKLADQKAQCDLCHRGCIVASGKQGFCKVRENRDGELITHAYGKASSIAVDPIEKKPLFHFLPNSLTLSIGGIGCNLGCKFCQNWSISHADIYDIPLQDVTPHILIERAKQNGCKSVAFTYNDPTINAEFIEEYSRIAKSEGMKTVVVSAGNIKEEARKNFYKNIDGANIDLKAFTESFYKKQTLSSLAPVKETLKYLVHETDVWTEITTLLIPGENDSSDEINELTAWIASELSTNIPIHFSAFHPAGEFRGTQRTPKETLDKAYKIAKENGLSYVYTGNVSDRTKSSTFCKNCEKLLIAREWFDVVSNEINDGICPYCQTEQDGIWN